MLRYAVEYLDRAIRLSPNDPWLPIYCGVRGSAEYINGNNDAAIEWAQKALQRNPDFFSTLNRTGFPGDSKS